MASSSEPFVAHCIQSVHSIVDEGLLAYPLRFPRVAFASPAPDTLLVLRGRCLWCWSCLPVLERALIVGFAAATSFCRSLVLS